MTIANLLDSGVISTATQLTADDIDCALRRMKNHLMLVDLKRKLLSPEADAGEVIHLSDEILSLQDAA